MSRLLITTPEYAIPAYASPIAAPVLAVSSDGTERDHFICDAGALIDPTFAVYPTISPMYTAGFFGDYYNHMYVIPSTLALIDPPVGVPNKFVFWSTYFDDTTISGIIGTDDTGMVLSFTNGEPIPGLKLTTESISITADAPEQETAHYLYEFTNGATTRWTVELVKTNLLGVSPQTPVNMVMKWKTDVIAAQDGTEQRISAAQFARIIHQVNYLFLDDDEHQTIYDQLFAKLNGVFAYPIWTEPTKLLADAAIGDSVIQIDTSIFDIAIGDSLYLDNETTTHEQVKIDNITGNAVTLATGLINAWTTQNKVYRTAQVLLPAKPSYNRSAWAKIEMKVDVTFIEFRDLFSADATTSEITSATILPDRIMSDTVYTLSNIPIIHARPIVDDTYKEEFDWNFQIVDYEIGTLEQLTNRLNAQVTYDRKFLINNNAKKFYWNWLLKWMHGQRKPVWLPSWFPDFNTTVLNVTGSTVKLQGETFLEHYQVESSNRGLWFTYGGGWFPRAILAINASGDGNTLVTLNEPVPGGYPTNPPFQDIGWLILARQATDEVQMEINPAYRMLSTTFIGTKDSPETPT